MKQEEFIESPGLNMRNEQYHRFTATFAIGKSKCFQSFFQIVERRNNPIIQRKLFSALREFWESSEQILVSDAIEAKEHLVCLLFNHAKLYVAHAPDDELRNHFLCCLTAMKRELINTIRFFWDYKFSNDSDKSTYTYKNEKFECVINSHYRGGVSFYVKNLENNIEYSRYTEDFSRAKSDIFKFMRK